MDEGKATRPKWWSRPRRASVDEPYGGVSGDGGMPPPEAATPPPGPSAPAGAPGGPGGTAPRPLHAEDPYHTPPYGGPGPWAPAPPVQRPGPPPGGGTTPAQGTAAAGPHPPAQAATPGRTGQLPGAAPAQAAAPPEAQGFPQSPWLGYDPWAAPHAAPEEPRRSGRRRAVIGAVLLALLAGGLGGAAGAYVERQGGFGDVELAQAPAEKTGRAPGSVPGIAEAVLPGVVTINVRGGGSEGTGTGFVLDDKGHILTNNHVVEPAGNGGKVQVTFNGGETAEAEVVGRDGGYDLAVVRVEGVSGLDPLPLGNSESVRVGDPVIAIGAPFGLDGTVTTGIISAKERPITAGGEDGASDMSYVDALQTDASINPGNSGGPLVDHKGRVIGINSAIKAAAEGQQAPGDTQGGSIGLGFAIPVNQAKRVAEELINTGKAIHPVIGVTLDMAYAGNGARVVDKGSGSEPVTPDGPGDKAGIRAGDLITEVDGQRVNSGEELIVKIRSHRPGDVLGLRLERDGKEKSVRLKLGTASGR
ncbi:trypsin-like peptidase domain-containing protein [Streptomyces sp. Z26]|uniref:S1C family serine protease n=1 Tax=Streptomyces sp. Z26 TaxID=2500177 RepID=UPI000EF1545F|nr:trypsin-like peptidase domain-containing protein [Streptomyces sp. Z26]RLL68767.1 PDZ domain-containing protein [Streptomyces sp. Z26]